ncbi:hypothetical protein K435DRAFT_968988 [Dendrothele bispora CBS 962.96]|uniref:Uncharacterized protein n=1 Tax=Dendrothele bispora (strain CBS 962.96) TaxID=1314807 RepID=A0A4S8LKD6_DENBC|nr:hypothetical protein K435DRAFT_968988 [Dendrothele bispora CBS 962.96]
MKGGASLDLHIKGPEVPAKVHRPKNLSSGILTVPHWAFTPLRNIGTVNLQAIAVDNQPDVMLSGLASTSGTVSENPTQTSSQTSSQTSPESSLSNTPKHGPDPVIISGGAVGGAVFVLLTTSFVFWRHRRKSRRDAVQSGEGGSRSRSTNPGDKAQNHSFSRHPLTPSGVRKVPFSVTQIKPHKLLLNGRSRGVYPPQRA